MSFLLLIFIGAVITSFYFFVKRVRASTRSLEDAIKSRKRLLLNRTEGYQRLFGFDSLVTTFNKLIDQHQAYANAQSGHTNQIKATLGAVQEPIFIFDRQRFVEYANEWAKRTFKDCKSFEGARLESILRSSTLLDYLEAYQEGANPAQAQIMIEQGSERYWFEASCAQIDGTPSEVSNSTLLVLHDITRLKGLEEMRREFVANVSHELRTPLTIIKGFAETLVENAKQLSEAERERFNKKILKNSERLHILVEDLLTLSRLESQASQIDWELASLGQLFEETVENNSSRLKRNDQKMVLEIDSELRDFEFDLYRINQVVDNLVENVFRYAPDFKELKLSAKLNADKSMVLCSVKDDGPGIPQKDLPHIFERFYRVDKGRSREHGGTGLGLSIMKHIVQLHGGDVRGESSAGQGTAIHFSIPYRFEG